jgi:transcription elongation GreA/GreB family factor
MSRAFTKEREDAPEPPLVLPRRAIAEPPEPPSDHGQVGFGATVTLAGAVEAENETTYTIVGADASDARHGKIAFDSPLAMAILGKRVGQRAVWHRPAGDRTVVVRAIRYE